MAPAGVLSYITVMADRPCRPDPDLKALWRMMLPGLSFPACGVPVDFGPTGDDAADKDDAVSPIRQAETKPRSRGGR